MMRRDYKRELERALEYAPVQVGALVVAHVYDADMDPGYTPRDSLAERPDDAMIGVNRGYVTPRNSVLAYDEDDLARLLESAADLIGIKEEDYDVGATIRHEHRHMEAWESLGAEACRYEVALIRVADTVEDALSGNTDIGFQPSALGLEMVLPKLAIASMSTRPYDVRESDIAVAIDLGYDGIQDIGDRIVQYNEKHPDQPLLLPLSYNRGPQQNR